MVRSFPLPRHLTKVLDEQATSAGKLYTGCVVEFWWVVRRNDFWMSESHLRRLVIHNDRWDTGILHSQSRQAIVHHFFDALATWRATRDMFPSTRPPHKLKRYFKIDWIQTGFRFATNQSGSILLLSRGMDGIHRRIPIEVAMPSYFDQFGQPTMIEVGWLKDRACSRCGFCAHRDVVGAINGRAKYLGLPPWNGQPVLEVTPVVGAVAAPTGVQYRPHMRALPINSGVARFKDRPAV
jgi:hypothetical protein